MCLLKSKTTFDCADQSHISLGIIHITNQFKHYTLSSKGNQIFALMKVAVFFLR